MFDPENYEFNEQRYRLTYNVIKLLLKISPLSVNVHGLGDKAGKSGIFLFNHFTRFETFIPQYILYDAGRMLCRAVADYKLFEDDLLGDYLRSVGAMPNNLKNIMDFMVGEINEGKSLVIFPEGGMIKDRRVRNEEGRLAIYKREGGIRRKPHTGAAVIAIKCRMLRDLYLMSREKSDRLMTEYYRKKFPPHKNPEEIDALAAESVEIIPANITFYPMRQDENILERYVRRFAGVKSKRVMEEIKVEGNILLKETDMDIRFGDPIDVAGYLGGVYHTILKIRYRLDKASAKKGGAIRKKAQIALGNKFDNLIAQWIKKHAGKIRDDYMCAIYDLTTINLAHLTAHTLIDLKKKDSRKKFELSYLRSLLYLAIADMRNLKGTYLHRDIQKRRYVDDLLLGEEPHFVQILEQFQEARLLKIKNANAVVLNEKLEKDFSFDKIRIENPAVVLDNEIQSVPKAIESLDKLYREKADLTKEKVTLYLHRRALKRFAFDEKNFTGPEFLKATQKEQRITSGAPFFFQTGKERKKRTGVLLIHGFSASPAEMKLLGNYLFNCGFDTYGLRLPGHGTSPADLRERNRAEWIYEVKLSITLLKNCCSRVFLVGNSMGALLGIITQENPDFRIDGLVAIAPAFKIKDRRLPFVTYVDAAQRFYRLFAELKTEWPYIHSRPEHPEINYVTLPYHGLFELYQVTKEAQEYLDKLEIPVLFIQADREYTVDPAATHEAFGRIPAKDKSLLMVEDDRHVLTLDEKLPVFGAISDFLERLSTKPL